MKFPRGLIRRLNAAQIAILGFGAVILMGAGLLTLPVSNLKRPPVSFVDALFTSTSAVCVTGLTVVDTGTTYTFFGQAVIVGLMEVGGLGIMTLGMLILLLLRRGAPLKMNLAARDSYVKLQEYSVGQLLLASVIFTLSIEALGMLMYFSVWIVEYPFGHALWLSIFHAVSAFCNAGFSLFPDNLMSQAEKPVVVYTVMALIVLGGIGFATLVEVWDWLSRDRDPMKRKLSLHSKLALLVTAILIVGGAVLVWIFEHDRYFAGMRPGLAFTHALFQSVTCRTAGFNTVDQGRLSDASLSVSMILMFIGGAPGGMAGGVKVTTFGVLVTVAISRLRGRRRPAVFNRSISRDDLEAAVSLVLLSMVAVILITFSLLVTELAGVSHHQSGGRFVEYLFETISAFGTVGLSTGVTPALTTAGRLIITAMMFLGRLGPLTLAVAMQGRGDSEFYRRPEERVLIG